MALNETQWKECLNCFISYPINSIYRTEEWFTINHTHDTATMELDGPLFIGEMLHF